MRKHVKSSWHHNNVYYVGVCVDRKIIVQCLKEDIAVESVTASSSGSHDTIESTIHVWLYKCTVYISYICMYDNIVWNCSSCTKFRAINTFLRDQSVVRLMSCFFTCGTARPLTLCSAPQYEHLHGEHNILYYLCAVVAT